MITLHIIIPPHPTCPVAPSLSRPVAQMPSRSVARSLSVSLSVLRARSQLLRLCVCQRHLPGRRPVARASRGRQWEGLERSCVSVSAHRRLLANTATPGRVACVSCSAEPCPARASAPVHPPTHPTSHLLPCCPSATVLVVCAAAAAAGFEPSGTAASRHLLRCAFPRCVRRCRRRTSFPGPPVSSRWHAVSAYRTSQRACLVPVCWAPSDVVGHALRRLPGSLPFCARCSALCSPLASTPVDFCALRAVCLGRRCSWFAAESHPWYLYFPESLRKTR